MKGLCKPEICLPVAEHIALRTSACKHATAHAFYARLASEHPMHSTHGRSAHAALMQGTAPLPTRFIRESSESTNLAALRAFHLHPRIWRIPHKWALLVVPIFGFSGTFPILTELPSATSDMASEEHVHKAHRWLLTVHTLLCINIRGDAQGVRRSIHKALPSFPNRQASLFVILISTLLGQLGVAPAILYGDILPVFIARCLHITSSSDTLVRACMGAACAAFRHRLLHGLQDCIPLCGIASYVLPLCWFSSPDLFTDLVKDSPQYSSSARTLTPQPVGSVTLGGFDELLAVGERKGASFNKLDNQAYTEAELSTPDPNQEYEPQQPDTWTADIKETIEVAPSNPPSQSVDVPMPPICEDVPMPAQPAPRSRISSTLPPRRVEGRSRSPSVPRGSQWYSDQAGSASSASSSWRSPSAWQWDNWSWQDEWQPAHWQGSDRQAWSTTDTSGRSSKGNKGKDSTKGSKRQD